MDCLSMSSRCSNRQNFDSNPNGSNLDRIAIGSMHPYLLGGWMPAVPLVEMRLGFESLLLLSGALLLLAVMLLPALPLPVQLLAE